MAAAKKTTKKHACKGCKNGKPCTECSKKRKAATQADSEISGNDGRDINKDQPSEGIDSSKACKILEDGTINGQPLSEAQRGMFGAACGKTKMAQKLFDKTNITAADVRKAKALLKAF